MTLTTEREFNIKYELDQAASAIEAARKLLLMPDPPPAKPLFLRIGEPKAVLDLFPDCPLYHVFNVPPDDSSIIGYDQTALHWQIDRAPPDCKHFVIDREGPLRDAIEFWNPDIAIPELEVRADIVKAIRLLRPGALVSDYGVVTHRRDKSLWDTVPRPELWSYLEHLDFVAPSAYPNRAVGYYIQLLKIARDIGSVLHIPVHVFLTHRSLPSFAVLDPPTLKQWVKMLSQYVDGGCSWEADWVSWDRRDRVGYESKRNWWSNTPIRTDEDFHAWHVPQRILTIETQLEGLNG